MSAPPDMAERHCLLLGELAELSMSLARRLHEQAMAAEPAEGLVLAFQRVSRSLRQTLALEAKLEREHRRGALEDARLADETRRARVKARRSQVNAALTRLIWTEGERCEIGEHLVDLNRLLEEESFHDGFLDDPVEAVIARIREDLGLPANDAAPGEAPSPLAGSTAGRPDDGRPCASPTIWRSAAPDGGLPEDVGCFSPPSGQPHIRSG